MEYPRFYCADQWPDTIAADTTFTLPSQVANHVGRVLRMRVGSTIHLFNDVGVEWAATITESSKQQVLVSWLEPVIRQNEAPFSSTILQAVSRGDRMDYTVQKGTEMGMTDFFPVLTERVGVKLDAKRWAKKVTHWQGVATSACEQSGRQIVPTIHQPVSFKQALQQSPSQQQLMLEIGADLSLATAIQQPLDSVTLLIGPEGDFTPAEIKQAQQAGFTGIHIGPRVLRTETVAPTVLAVLQALYGDWQ